MFPLTIKLSDAEPYLDADGVTAGQEIPRSLWNLQHMYF